VLNVFYLPFSATFPSASTIVNSPTLLEEWDLILLQLSDLTIQCPLLHVNIKPAEVEFLLLLS